MVRWVSDLSIAVLAVHRMWQIHTDEAMVPLKASAFQSVQGNSSMSLHEPPIICISPDSISQLDLWLESPDSDMRRLSEQKLKTLYSDLKVQEKEEIVLKRAIADGLDKEGLKEAETRRRLKGNVKVPF
ncbi:hypothetical protein QYM36_000648 [Artemia franciscana]|uniref:Alpha-2-macroglobulin receptor-associated protein domain-containing protein n=1 Tax=Artemia franciscana TaxID=6661 RepID=A0AA88ICW5_ARTSF|nr:hypothetical protein QYM36_000648 [Artemia franciscana]